MFDELAHPLVIALSKGRPLAQQLALLQRLGIEPSEDITTSRKLVVKGNHPQIRLMVLRGHDVATYVEHGIADIGIVGKDVLLEFPGDNFYEPLDLKLSQCQLIVAGLIDEKPLPRRLRVATKFIETAKRFYASEGTQIDMIRLTGGLELAPVMGLADRIVDIVETGSTLVANGLEPKAFICDISSRLIINKVAFKTKQPMIDRFIESMMAETQ
ncbi:MAG: ATP phosphoribosyltransferase [Pseudomonadales bacterium]|jgi:ATP phosphoribosyltransferase|nr:ATP phosphoribosyltransferase [Pseudomonadales bacterium]MDA0958784.1 ATP phosphoribosyltransferase [Pseudomonadota bacterium]MDA1206054.1 ATP phosphoribosyltransferase [Pseudomonadota bacterium]